MPNPPAPPPGFEPVASIPPPPAGFSPIADPSGGQESPDGWQPTKYGFSVKPIQIGNVQTLQRQDGAAWFGPEQGNKGQPGWFNAQGQRVGDAPAPPEAAPHAWMNQPIASLLGPTATLAQVLGHKLMGDHGTNPTVGGVTHGVASDVIAPAQLAAHAVGSSAVDPLANQTEAYFGSGDKGGQMLGQAAPFFLTAGGSEAAQAPGQALTTAQKAAQVAGTIGKATLGGAVAAPALTMESNVQSPEDYWSRKLAEAKMGAATGGALGTAGTILGQGVPSAINAWAEKFRNPKAAQLLDDLAATNNPMKASDIMTATKAPPPEVAAAEKTVMDLKNELTNTMNNTQFAVGELPKVAEGNGPRSGAAKAILAQAAQEGDPEKLLSTSAGIRAVQEKIRMDQLGSAVEGLSQGVSGPLTNAANAVDQRIKFLQQDLYNPGGNQAEINALENLKERFLGTPPDTLGVHQPGATPLPTYQQARATRSNLGSIISDLYKGKNVVTGQPDAATLQAIKNGLQSDMSNMAQQSGRPALAAADRAFQSEYSKYAGTFKDPDVIKVIQNPNPDTLMATLAKAGPNKAQKIMDVLDPKGQAAYAVGTFDQAIAKAVNKRTGGDIIPGNISGGINDVNDALGVVIKDPALKARMDSMLNVMQALARTNPQQASALGQRITGSVMEANSKLNIAAKLYQGIKDFGVDTFFNSPAGKDFLFKAQGLKPESPMMLTLIRDKAPQILAAQAARPSVAPAMASKPSPQQPEIAQVNQ